MHANFHSPPFRPVPPLANLHSQYFAAFILPAIFWPWALVIGVFFSPWSVLSVAGSSRKSVFVPTRMIGIASVQYCLISGIHLV